MKYFNSDFLGFLGALVGALISGIFAIIVFTLSKSSENKKEKKELLSFGELYCTSINVMQESYVSVQITFMDEFIQEIKEKKYNPHRLKIIDASNYLDRISKINIQEISKLYVLLNRETKNLVLAVNSLDFIKNQLQNYVLDANNSFTESYNDSKQIFAIYSSIWNLDKNLPHPSTIQEIIQIEKILKEKRYDKSLISQVQIYRQKIENRNEALIVSYSNIKDNLLTTNKALFQEVTNLKELIEKG